jgi:DNA-binding beta-propeller fold protein YncE
MRLRWIAIIVLAASAVSAGLAQSVLSAALLVLSKGDRMLAIVDPGTLEVVARMPSGPDPHEVEASSDGRLAYVSNYGSGAYNTITIVDLVAQRTLRAFDLGPLRGPHGLDYVGGKLYFTAEANKVIGRYDPAAEKVDWVMGTGQDRTHMLKVSKDLNRIVTSNVGSATVSLLDQAMSQGRGGSPQVSWTETVIDVGKGSEGFDVSPDWREVWVANAGDGNWLS